MSSGNRRNGVCAVLPVIVVFLFAHGLGSWQWPRSGTPRSAETPPPGRFSDKAILARSESLCRVLVPEKRNLRLEAERNDAWTRDGAHGRYWDVYAFEEAGKNVLYLKWEADTGQVWIAGCREDAFESEGPQLGRQEIVRSGERWLHLLWGPRQSPRWRLVHATKPEPANRTCDLVWQAGGETVLLVVNSYSGGLLLAKRKQGGA